MKHTLLVLLFLIPFAGFGQPRGRIVEIDNSVFVAMVDDSFSGCLHRQQKDNWCWAACVQMMMDYEGETVSQADVARYVFGSVVDRTASGNQIASSLNGWRGLYWKNLRERDGDKIAEALVNGSPLMIGLGEHAYILTHLFLTKKGGRYIAFKVIIVNPKTAKEEVMAWTDFFPRINTILQLNR